MKRKRGQRGPGHWNEKTATFVKEYAKSANGAQSAKNAGYSTHSPTAKVTAHKLLRRPKVKKAIEEVRQSVIEEAKYGLQEAIAEINEMLAEARDEKGRYMAVPRLLEMKLKLYGLLVEKHHVEIERVDIKAALDEANARVTKLLMEPLEDRGDGDIFS